MNPARGPDCAHRVKSDLAVSVHGSSLSSTATSARTHACVLGAMQKCQGRRACVLVFVRRESQIGRPAWLALTQEKQASRTASGEERARAESGRATCSRANGVIPLGAGERLGERLKLRGVAQRLAMAEEHELGLQLGQATRRLAVASHVDREQCGWLVEAGARRIEVQV